MATVKELHGEPVRRQKKKKELVDESIQGTNSSSIVSKRSVERLYWARKEGRNHVEFFRQFVPKPIRRSPVINRGYWTRMEAMRHVISKVCLILCLIAPNRKLGGLPRQTFYAV
jgi:hypothetical protein